MNLTGTMTVSSGKYNLASIDTSATEVPEVIQHLLQFRHLMYDWGAHYFFVRKVAFYVKYSEEIITNAKGEPVDSSDWIGCEPDTLHNLLRPVFEGEWSPTPADIIARLMRSGIKVDIFDTEKYGPKNPKMFMETLRKAISN